MCRQRPGTEQSLVQDGGKKEAIRTHPPSTAIHDEEFIFRTSLHRRETQGKEPSQRCCITRQGYPMSELWEYVKRVLPGGRTVQDTAAATNHMESETLIDGPTTAQRPGTIEEVCPTSLPAPDSERSFAVLTDQKQSPMVGSAIVVNCAPDCHSQVATVEHHITPQQNKETSECMVVLTGPSSALLNVAHADGTSANVVSPLQTEELAADKPFVPSWKGLTADTSPGVRSISELHSPMLRIAGLQLLLGNHVLEFTLLDDYENQLGFHEPCGTIAWPKEMHVQIPGEDEGVQNPQQNNKESPTAISLDWFRCQHPRCPRPTESRFRQLDAVFLALLQSVVRGCLNAGCPEKAIPCSMYKEHARICAFKARQCARCNCTWLPAHGDHYGTCEGCNQQLCLPQLGGHQQWCAPFIKLQSQRALAASEAQRQADRAEQAASNRQFEARLRDANLQTAMIMELFTQQARTVSKFRALPPPDDSNPGGAPTHRAKKQQGTASKEKKDVHQQSQKHQHSGLKRRGNSRSPSPRPDSSAKKSRGSGAYAVGSKEEIVTIAFPDNTEQRMCPSAVHVEVESSVSAGPHEWVSLLFTVVHCPSVHFSGRYLLTSSAEMDQYIEFNYPNVKPIYITNYNIRAFHVSESHLTTLKLNEGGGSRSNYPLYPINKERAAEAVAAAAGSGAASRSSLNWEDVLLVVHAMHADSSKHQPSGTGGPASKLPTSYSDDDNAAMQDASSLDGGDEDAERDHRNALV